MTMPHGEMLGMLFALGALVLWSISPFFFTFATRRIGAFSTNLIRLCMALPFLFLACGLEWFGTGTLVSVHWSSVLLLLLSGIIGLSIGDQFLFTALSEMGPERTSLIMTLSPAATSALAWIFLHENLALEQIVSILLILGGVLITTWQVDAIHLQKKIWKGLFNGLASALCQAIGAILARQAFHLDGHFSSVFATTLRISAGALTLLLLAGFSGRLKSIISQAREPLIARRLILGTIAGPVCGMLLFVSALKFQAAGIVSTITFMTPLIIIPLGAYGYGTKLGWRVLLGAGVGLIGVVWLGLY